MFAAAAEAHREPLLAMRANSGRQFSPIEIPLVSAINGPSFPSLIYHGDALMNIGLPVPIRGRL